MEQLGIVDERLRQLYHPLLHPRGVAAMRTYRSSNKPTLPQHFGGALSRGGEWKAGNAAHVRQRNPFPLTSTGRQSCLGM
jgi:hypothetical protein